MIKVYSILENKLESKLYVCNYWTKKMQNKPHGYILKCKAKMLGDKETGG